VSLSESRRWFGCSDFVLLLLWVVGHVCSDTVQ
jgi:hypothetical protein